MPILKSMVVRVPAGWASAWRIAARSEPAVGAVLLPLSAAVVTVSVESIWRPSRGSTENRRRERRGAAGGCDLAPRGGTEPSGTKTVDMLSVLWVWADCDRRARATTAAVPQPARGPLPDSPRSAQVFVSCRRDKPLPATSVIDLGTSWELPSRVECGHDRRFFAGSSAGSDDLRGLIRPPGHSAGCPSSR